MTFFDDIKKDFKDVKVTDEKINTSDFLEASEGLVHLFGE